MSRKKRIEKMIEIVLGVIDITNDVEKNTDSCELKSKCMLISAVFSIASIVIKEADKQNSKEVYKIIKNLYNNILEGSLDNKLFVEMMYDALYYEDENTLSYLKDIVLRLNTMNPEDLKKVERDIIVKSLDIVEKDFIKNKLQEEGE